MYSVYWTKEWGISWFLNFTAVLWNSLKKRLADLFIEIKYDSSNFGLMWEMSLAERCTTLPWPFCRTRVQECERQYCHCFEARKWRHCLPSFAGYSKLSLGMNNFCTCQLCGYPWATSLSFYLFSAGSMLFAHKKEGTFKWQWVWLSFS